MIDLHCHILPGIDDGPRDVDGALALARAAVDAGTGLVAATPHIGTEHGVDPLEVSVRVWELERELERAGIPLALEVGGEVAPGGVADLMEADLTAIALGGGSCVLLECPFTAAGDLMLHLVDHLHERGRRVLLAHPERSPSFVGDVRRLEELVRRGAFVQVTAAALDGGFGRPAWRFSSRLLERGLAHVVASDAHDAVRRPPELRALVEQAVWDQGLPEELTQYLLQDAPRALLDDAAVPAAPVLARKQRWPRRG